MLFKLCLEKLFCFKIIHFCFFVCYNVKTNFVCYKCTYLLMLWWPFNLLQSNKRTVPSVLALAKRDELELRAVSFVTDDLCSCRWAISVPFMLWPGGINDARLSAAFESLFAFKSTYWLFSLVCNMWSSFRQSEFLSVFWEVKFLRKWND